MHPLPSSLVTPEQYIATPVRSLGKLRMTWFGKHAAFLFACMCSFKCSVLAEQPHPPLLTVRCFCAAHQRKRQPGRPACPYYAIKLPSWTSRRSKVRCLGPRGRGLLAGQEKARPKVTARILKRPAGASETPELLPRPSKSPKLKVDRPPDREHSGPKTPAKSAPPPPPPPMAEAKQASQHRAPRRHTKEKTRPAPKTPPTSLPVPPPPPTAEARAPPVQPASRRALETTSKSQPGFKGTGKMGNFGNLVPGPMLVSSAASSSGSTIPPPATVDILQAYDEAVPTVPGASSDWWPSACPEPIAATAEDVRKWFADNFTRLDHVNGSQPPKTGTEVLWRGFKKGKKGGMSTTVEWFNGTVANVSFVEGSGADSGWYADVS